MTKYRQGIYQGLVHICDIPPASERQQHHNNTTTSLVHGLTLVYYMPLVSLHVQCMLSLIRVIARRSFEASNACLSVRVPTGNVKRHYNNSGYFQLAVNAAVVARLIVFPRSRSGVSIRACHLASFPPSLHDQLPYGSHTNERHLPPLRRPTGGDPGINYTSSVF